MKLRFAIIDCEDEPKWEDEGSDDLWRQKLREADKDEEWVVFRAYRGELPTIEDGFDGVLIPGSHYSVYERLPWMLELEEFVREAYVPWRADWSAPEHAAKPMVVGSCFGHQMIAQALGGSVAPNPRGRYICRAEAIYPTEAFARMPFSEGIVLRTKHGIAAQPNEMLWERHVEKGTIPYFRVTETHGDSVVTLPADTQVLAISDSTTNEMFLTGRNLLAFQSHPEFEYESHLLRKVVPYVYPDLMSDADRLEADESFSLPLHSDAMIEVVRRFLKGDFPARPRPASSVGWGAGGIPGVGENNGDLDQMYRMQAEAEGEAEDVGRLAGDSSAGDLSGLYERSVAEVEGEAANYNSSPSPSPSSSQEEEEEQRREQQRAQRERVGGQGAPLRRYWAKSKSGDNEDKEEAEEAEEAEEEAGVGQPSQRRQQKEQRQQRQQWQQYQQYQQPARTFPGNRGGDTTATAATTATTAATRTPSRLRGGSVSQEEVDAEGLRGADHLRAAESPLEERLRVKGRMLAARAKRERELELELELQRGATATAGSGGGGAGAGAGAGGAGGPAADAEEGFVEEDADAGDGYGGVGGVGGGVASLLSGIMRRLRAYTG